MTGYPRGDLRRELKAARKTLARIDAATSEEVRHHGDQLLAEYGQALHVIRDSTERLEQRRGERISLRRRILNSQRSPVVRALESAALRLGGGLSLDPSRLSDEQARQLHALVKRWDERETLLDDERMRVEELVGTAAGNAGVFEQRRTRKRLEEAVAHAKAEAKRLPQAESVVGAVMADESLIDDMRFRHRPDAIRRDEYGKEIPAGFSRVLEPEHVATLHLVLHAIGENGGRPITIDANGEIGDDLPRVAIPAVGHLRVNRLLSNRRDDTGTGWLCGYGPVSAPLRPSGASSCGNTLPVEPFRRLSDRVLDFAMSRV